MWPLRDPGHLNWVFTNITQASSVTTAKEKSKRGWFSLTVKCFDPKMARVTTAYSLLPPPRGAGKCSGAHGMFAEQYCATSTY